MNNLNWQHQTLDPMNTHRGMCLCAWAQFFVKVDSVRVREEMIEEGRSLFLKCAYRQNYEGF